MKKLGILLLIAILLTACQPTATSQPPTISPTEPLAQTATQLESLVSSVNDLLGVWWFSSPGVKLEFKADGTFRFFYIDTTIDEGNYSFDNSKVFFTTPGTGGCRGQTATYEVYVTKQDGKPIWLRLQVLGSDPCPGRGDTTSHRAKFLNP